VTLDVVTGLPSLRDPKCRKVIWGATADSADRPGFRIVQFSIQDRHLHLIVEARDARALSRGIQGLKVRIARRLNKRLGRTGPLFADRYHQHILRTPREVYHALQYVLGNAFKHQADQGLHDVGYLYDACSSAAYFDGWQRGYSLAAHRHRGPPPVAPARTWLLRRGWIERHGPMPWNARPAPRPRP
jgi:REP element-mobilizing transposase RayT